MTLSIRGRLTLWYAAVLSVVLAACAVAFYFVYARSLQAQLDEELAKAGGLVDQMVRAELQQGLALPDAAREGLEDIEMPGRSFAAFDERGAFLFGRWEGLPHEDAGLSWEGDSGRATVTTRSGPVRVFRERKRFGDATFQIGVAEPLSLLERSLSRVSGALLGSAFFSLLVAAGGGWWIARGALRPVALLSAQAQRISGRMPNERLEPPNPNDELGRLAGSFNDLLGRLEAAMAQQRQFMAEASHELRTPVSIARTAGEVTLGTAGRPEEEYREAFHIVSEQMRRLSRIVEDMFTLARADASGLPLERRALYLDELVAASAKDAQLLASPLGVEIVSSGDEDVEIVGDERRLRELLMNVLANAVHHTPTGGRVAVALATRPGEVEIHVTDTGRGIPEADRERIFQRFVRLDGARQPADGAGLGLPIARAIAEAHGGTLVLARSDASGSTFVARLPR